MQNKTLKRNKFFSINIDVDTIVAEPNSHDFELARPSFFKFIPRFIAILDKYNVKATFFIVGKFAKDKGIAKAIKELANNGHEIGNHTFSHHRSLVDFAYKDIYEEISESDKILSDTIGRKIVGFRSPGYVLSPDILRVLKELNYLYDSSLNTSIFYCALKWVWWRFSRRGSGSLKLQPLSHCFRSSDPFFININDLTKYKKQDSNDNHVCEIPIPTIPVASYPFVGTLVNKHSVLLETLYYLLNHKKYLHLELHDIEFAGFHEVSSIRNVNTTVAARHVDKNIKLYDGFLKIVSEDYKFKTLEGMALSFNEQ